MDRVFESVHDALSFVEVIDDPSRRRLREPINRDGWAFGQVMAAPRVVVDRTERLEDVVCTAFTDRGNAGVGGDAIALTDLVEWHL